MSGALDNSAGGRRAGSRGLSCRELLSLATPCDRTGKAVNWNGGTEAMQLAPEIYASIQRSGIPAHFDIDLPRVPVYLEAGVHDLTNGKVGTLRIPLNPAESTAMASAH